MANYLTARAAIAAVIEDVAITSPVTLAMKRVYETPPDAGQGLSDYPCVLITGSAIDEWSRSAGMRERTYRVGLRMGIRPSGVGAAPMQEIIQAFRDAIGVAFDQHIGLNASGFHVMDGPIWPAVEPQADGGVVWDDGEMTIHCADDGAFAG